MNHKTIHIVSFDVPFPPDYGGVIDVFYKIKALKEAGVKVILHCFDYGRGRPKDLEQYCVEVHYYKRKTHLGKLITLAPYIVKSRENKILLNQLLKDDYPILFEGLHTCSFLNHPQLKNRKKAVRTHNIEHHYYKGLAEAEKSLIKKRFLRIESKKLERFEKVLLEADKIFSISKNDKTHLEKKFNNVFHLPVFHGFHFEGNNVGTGQPYALYHGNLSVSENANAAAYLIEKVFINTDLKLFIAGNQPPDYLVKLIDEHAQITLKNNISTEEIHALISNAQVNILPTFQPTGIKLKLLAALFLGKHCVVNKAMVQETGLENCCWMEDDAEKMTVKIQQLMKEAFSKEDLIRRKKCLEPFSKQKSIKILLDWLD